MRWIVPFHNTIKIKKKFLLFPKKYENEIRWLEKVYCVYVYKDDYNIFKWKFIRFLDLEEYEQICPKHHYYNQTICSRCNNTFKIPWTETIKGK